MAEVSNQCAGSFGAIYDFYMERPWLSRLIGRVAWGIDLAPLYSNIDAIGSLADESVLDVPCGAGLALRSVSPTQDVRIVALDIDDEMLARTRQKASAKGLQQIETVKGDMRELPFDDGSFDRLYSFSGLHMIGDPEAAIREFARVLKPGGSLVGSSFVADGTRRKRWLFQTEERRKNIAKPPAEAATIGGWLDAAEFTDINVGGRGFVYFRATRT